MIADERILGLPKVSLKTKELLPEYSGIYYVVDQNNVVMYIGKAKNLCKRWQGKSHHRIHQLNATRNNYFYLYYEQVSQYNLDQVEKSLIEKYKPELNDTPVRKSKIWSTEALLRETIRKIDEFILILGVSEQYKTIYINFDYQAFKRKYSTQSLDEEIGLIKGIFISRKNHIKKWEWHGRVKFANIHARLEINGFKIDIQNRDNVIEILGKKNICLSFQEVDFVGEKISALSQEDFGLLNQEEFKIYDFQRLKLRPYINFEFKVILDEDIKPHLIAKENLEKIQEHYSLGIRGKNSRTVAIKKTILSLDELLISRGIQPDQTLLDVCPYRGNDAVRLYIYLFAYKKLRENASFGTLYGKVENQITFGLNFIDVVYLTSGTNRKIWLLLDKFINDFSYIGYHITSPNFQNNHAYAESIWISARKYIQPARMTIKFEGLANGFGIPFGQDLNQKFTTFEAAKTEITRRLNEADLPPFKLTFTPEKIVTKGRR